MEFVAIDTPVQVTGEELDEILETDLPVLLLLWNGDTLRNDVKAELDKAAKEQAGRLLVVKADVSKSPEAAERWQLGKHPLAIALFNGEVLMRRPRPWNTDVQAMVEELVKLAPPLEEDVTAVAAKPANDVIFTKPVHVTEETFQSEVLDSPLPVIVDFWADWCGPCKMVAPILDKIAKDQAGKLIVAKVNTDDNSQWAMKYNVQGIPTMLFVADGKIVHRQVGALPERALRDLISQFLNLVENSNKANVPAQ